MAKIKEKVITQELIVILVHEYVTSSNNSLSLYENFKIVFNYAFC